MEFRNRIRSNDSEADCAIAEREFAFSDVDFRMLAQFAHEKAGIALSDAKRNLVYGRLSRRVRALSLTSFREYREYLATDSDEVQRFINCISTNLTKFFREVHHFKHFKESIAKPFAVVAQRNPNAKLRVWSAGCSTGEEPYSIAAILHQVLPNPFERDVRVLATDVDTDVLAAATSGNYAAEATESVPAPYRNIFEEIPGDPEGRIRIKREVGACIRFRRLNLIEPWPFRQRFDAIFCRNVMIYFDAPTKATLLQRLAEQLVPGGWLYIGHSESLTRSHSLLELEGKTIYRRRI
jgi:chemotaxis protein methyltransferase CheR